MAVYAFPGDELSSEFTLCEPLCSSCLRVKKKTFGGNLITLVMIQSILKRPYYFIKKMVTAYCSLLHENEIIRLDEKRKCCVTKVIQLLFSGKS